MGQGAGGCCVGPRGASQEHRPLPPRARARIALPRSAIPRVFLLAGMPPQLGGGRQPRRQALRCETPTVRAFGNIHALDLVVGLPGQSIHEGEAGVGERVPEPRYPRPDCSRRACRRPRYRSDARSRHQSSPDRILRQIREQRMQVGGFLEWGGQKDASDQIAIGDRSGNPDACRPPEFSGSGMISSFGIRNADYIQWRVVVVLQAEDQPLLIGRVSSDFNYIATDMRFAHVLVEQ